MHVCVDEARRDERVGKSLNRRVGCKPLRHVGPRAGGDDMAVFDDKPAVFVVVPGICRSRGIVDQMKDAGAIGAHQERSGRMSVTG